MLNKGTSYSNDIGEIRTVVTMFNGRGGVSSVSYTEENQDVKKNCTMKQWKKWLIKRY